MNWNKAKTILIIAFIILNLFLLYAIFEDRTENYEGLDDDFIEKVENNLEAKNIFIEAEVPKEIYKMPLIEVEYRIFSQSDVKYYLGEDYEEKIEDEYFVKNDGSYIRIENNKKLIYNIRDIDKNLSIDTEEAKKYIEKYAEDNNINLEEYKLDIETIEEDFHSFIYKKIYNDRTLENDFYKFIVDNKGVAGLEFQNIKKVEPKEGLIYVTSAYESLLRLNNSSNIKKTIEKVEICYYSDENISDWENIVRANMDPTWKVVFEDGNIKYLTETE